MNLLKCSLNWFRSMNVTKVKLLDLFASYWEKTECRELDNGEFDFYIRFLDKPDDTYYYCFKDEGIPFIFIIDFCQRIMRILDFEQA